VILHKSSSRNLRRWEQDIDSELGETRWNSFQSTENRSMQMADRTRRSDEIVIEDDASFQHASRLTFGPKNCFDHASWVENIRKSRSFRRCSTSRLELTMPSEYSSGQDCSGSEHLGSHNYHNLDSSICGAVEGQLLIFQEVVRLDIKIVHSSP
jgi:hypothetical protein